MKKHLARACITAGLLLLSLPSYADEVETFYRGRTVSIVVGHEPGTGFDLYGRALSRHLSRFLPGHPTVTVQNMTGASGLVAANWLYNVAPRDGTVMATFAHTVSVDPLTGEGGAKFDATKFNWIGNMDESVPICGVGTASGLRSFEDLLGKEARFGATGATGPLTQTAAAVNNLLGAKIKLVQGYRGSHAVKLAIERGEVSGVCGLSVSTLRAEWRDLVERQLFTPVLQLGRNRSPDLGNLPHAYDFAKTDLDGQVYDLVFGVQALGRGYVAPPDVPKERVRALRDALLATVRDPTFVAEAAAVQMTLNASSGEEVENMIRRFYSASPEAVARARRAVKPN